MKLTLTSILLVILTLSAKAWTELSGNIRGIITNQESGQVVRGATLRLIPFSGGKPTNIVKAFSQDEGEYIFANVTPGLYNVECNAFGYKTMRLVGLQVREDRTKLAYFKLQRGPAAEIQEVFTYASIEAQQQIKTQTTAATAEALGTAPATVYSIKATEIELHGYSSLDELLLDVPEFQIQRYFSGKEGNMVSARGVFGNEKLLILIDGHRYNSMTSSKYSIFENYNIRYAERVDIIIGPASALYGADAYMGVINIITKKSNKIKGASISTEYGMYNTTQTSFETGWGSKDVSFGVQGSYFQTDGPPLNQLYPNEMHWFNNYYSQTGEVLTSPVLDNSTTVLPIRPFSFKRHATHGALNFKYKDFNASINFNLETHSSSSGIRPEYSPYWDKSLIGTTLVSLNLQQRYFKKNKNLSGETDFTTSVYFMNTHSEYINTFSGYKDAYKAATDGGARFTQTFTYRFHKNHNITAGLYGQFSNVLPQTSDLPTRPKAPFLPISPISTAENNYYYLGTNVVDRDGQSLKLYQNFYYLRRLAVGSFLEYKGSINNKLFLTAGLRYDHIVDIGFYQTPYSIKGYSSISPRVGVVYKPMKELVAKAYVGRGFLQPPPERKYQHFGVFTPATNNAGEITHIQGGFWRLPNPDLKAESVNTIETAVRYSKGDFLLSANGYFNTIYGSWTLTLEESDSIRFLGIPIPTAERETNSLTPIFTYGATLVSAYRMTWGAEEQYQLRLNASYSYASGFSKDLAQIPYTAKHMAKLGLLLKIHNFSWYNSLSYRTNTYGQPNSSDKNIQYVAPHYFLWNIFMRYRLVDKDKFQLSVFTKVCNVLDTRYYNVTENSVASFGASPQDPIIITGGITVNFGRNQY